MSENQLIVTETLDPKEVFTGDNPIMNDLVQQVKDETAKEIAKFKYDANTDEGRKGIISLAYKIIRSKTALDDMGKDFNSEMRDFISAVNVHRNYAKAELEPFAKEIRKPVTDLEEEEERQEAALEARFLDLKEYNEHTNMSLEALKNGLEAIEATVIDESWSYLEEKAQELKDDLILTFNQRIEQEETREKEQAELEQFRKDKAEREEKDRAEAAEKVRIKREQEIRDDAAQKATQEAEAAKEAAEQAEKRRIKDLADAKEKAEQDKIDAAERAEREKQEAVEAEQKRVEGVKKAEEAEQTKLANNKRHNHKIHTEAKEALIVAGLSDQAATQAVTAIYKNMIPHISIRY